jgi:hypothetical protein
MPGKCYRLKGSFRDAVQSLRVDSESTCNFFMFVILLFCVLTAILNCDYSQDACVGQSLFLNGSLAILPPPYPNNTLSYKCEDDQND